MVTIGGGRGVSVGKSGTLIPPEPQALRNMNMTIPKSTETLVVFNQRRNFMLCLSSVCRAECYAIEADAYMLPVLRLPLRYAQCPLGTEVTFHHSELHSIQGNRIPEASHNFGRNPCLAGCPFASSNGSRDRPEGPSRWQNSR